MTALARAEYAEAMERRIFEVDPALEAHGLPESWAESAELLMDHYDLTADTAARTLVVLRADAIRAAHRTVGQRKRTDMTRIHLEYRRRCKARRRRQR